MKGPLLGCVADDLTGAVDLAGRLVREGASVVLGVGAQDPLRGSEPPDAVVLALKSRSVPAAEAVRLSLDAASRLRDLGCGQLYFKYGSTFDSTESGNIGPVVDALLRETGEDATVLCPSLPENARTVRDGVLYVHGEPLAQSSMSRHPLNPMLDSRVRFLMERQASGRAGGVHLDIVRCGPGAVLAAFRAAARAGASYVVLDAETDADLRVLGEACRDMPLVTGASALAGEIVAARLGAGSRSRRASRTRGAAPGRTVVLAGSCSTATVAQVEALRARVPSIGLPGDSSTSAESLAARAIDWVRHHPDNEVLVFSTPQVDITTGELSPEAVERAFTEVASALLDDGFTKFVVAGGETSGAVVQGLGLGALDVGREVQVGVPVAYGAARNGRRVGVVLKSGNFGDAQLLGQAVEVLDG